MNLTRIQQFGYFGFKCPGGLQFLMEWPDDPGRFTRIWPHFYEDRCRWIIAIEAVAMGADIDMVGALMDRWCLKFPGAIEQFTANTYIDLSYSGVFEARFALEENSIVGRGSSELATFVDLADQAGRSPYPIPTSVFWRN